MLWVCVSSLWYTACTMLAPYFRLWPVRVYNIFSTLFHKAQDFLCVEKGGGNYWTCNVCVFLFFLLILCEIFLSLIRIQRSRTAWILFRSQFHWSCFPFTPRLTSSEHLALPTHVPQSCAVITLLRIMWRYDSVVARVSYFESSPKMTSFCLVFWRKPSRCVYELLK
jgi:hypothetical protein